MATERYLRFDSKGPKNGKALLWPVHVWRVLYPAARRLPLNLFQEAILGLVRARCRDAAEMADLLRLDRDLVALIIASQLVPNGWMTTEGGLTDKGERVLEDAEDIDEEMSVGYAFQDGMSGSWLPRFSEELPEVEPVESDSAGSPIFLGSRESGDKRRPFRIVHSTEGRLDLNDLLEAYNRYRADLSFARQREEAESLPDQVRIERIDCIDRQPVPMWLWTYVFAEPGGAHPWLIADPFGFQNAASWLRKPAQELLRTNNDLARFIGSSTGDTRPENVSASEWLANLESEIDLTLFAAYPWSGKVPTIAGYLASVLRRQVGLSRQDKVWQEDVSSLLIEAHNLTESVLQWLLEKFPVDMRRLPHWKDQRHWKEGEARHYLEFFNLECLTEAVVKRLEGQSLDQVRTAARSRSSSLKALLFAALLSTVDQKEHPFLSIQSGALALGRVLDLADARNRRAGHAGSNAITKDEAMDHVDFIVDWIDLFKEWY